MNNFSNEYLGFLKLFYYFPKRRHQAVRPVSRSHEVRAQGELRLQRGHGRRDPQPDARPGIAKSSTNCKFKRSESRLIQGKHQVLLERVCLITRKLQK